MQRIQKSFIRWIIIVSERQLTKLTKLEPVLDDIGEVKSYYYLSSPDYPVMRDKPNKLMILSIAFCLGIFYQVLLYCLEHYFNLNENEK